MIDSVLKGTGNSRFLKSAVPAGTSWADAMAMLQAGTFPIDFNGINTEGFQQVGTPLNKANLLKDATAAQIGLPPSTTPDGMFQALGNTGELHIWRKTVTTSQEIPAGYTLENALENINPIKLTDKNYNTAWFAVVSSVKIDDNGNVHFTDADSDYTRYMRWNSSDHVFEGYAAVSGGGPGVIRHDGIPGKFIKFWAKSSSWLSPLIDTDSFYFVPSDATVTTGSTPVFSKLQRVVGYAKTPAGTTTTYPVSTNPNAYQEGDDAKAAGYVVGEVVTGKFAVSFHNAAEGYYYKVSGNIDVSSSGSVSMPSTSENVLIDYSHNNSTTAVKNKFAGKFVQFLYRNGGDGRKFPDTKPPFNGYDIVYIPDNVSVTQEKVISNNDFVVDRYQPVTGYPAIPAGTTIEYLGKLGDKARVQVVSYVGTGTYGKNNPNSITLDFIPKLFWISGNGYAYETDMLVFYGETNKSEGNSDYYFTFDNISWKGKKVSWYSTRGSELQANISGEKYIIRAIG